MYPPLQTTMSPLHAVRDDKALNERLMREAFEEAFCDVLDELQDEEDEEEGLFAALASDAVACAILTGDSFEACIRLRSLGWSVASQDLRAFENLFRMVERDRHALLCERSRRIGYRGPVGRPSLITSDGDVTLVFQPAELLEECEVIAVYLHDFVPERRKDGALDIWTMRWLDIKGEIIDCDDAKLVGEVQKSFVEQKSRFVRKKGDRTSFDRQSLLEDLFDMFEAAGSGDCLPCDPAQFTRKIDEVKRAVADLISIAPSDAFLISNLDVSRDIADIADQLLMLIGRR